MKLAGKMYEQNVKICWRPITLSELINRYDVPVHFAKDLLGYSYHKC